MYHAFGYCGDVLVLLGIMMNMIITKITIILRIIPMMMIMTMIVIVLQS